MENYFYDVENRLLGYRAQDGATVLRQMRFVYDGVDRRILKVVDPDGDGPLVARARRYGYDGVDLVSEVGCGYTGSLDPAVALGTLVNCQPRSQWTHGDGVDTPLWMLTEADGLPGWSKNDGLVYHTDHLGSVQAMTDVSGSVVAQFVYDSYGNQVAVLSGSMGAYTETPGVLTEVVSTSGLVWGNPFTYTAREWDPESGLYYYRARYYDSLAGVFLEEDPIFAENLYGYVGGNPVNRVDPSGQVAMVIPLVVAAVVVAGAGGLGYHQFLQGQPPPKLNLNIPTKNLELCAIAVTSAATTMASLAMSTSSGGSGGNLSRPRPPPPLPGRCRLWMEREFPDGVQCVYLCFGWGGPVTLSLPSGHKCPPGDQPNPVPPPPGAGWK